MRRQESEAARRARERREREDASPRLQDTVRRLRGLSISIGEHGKTGALAGTRYVRHVVVARAPALFIIPCTEASCEDGGHDVTMEVLAALRAGRSEFSGKNTCRGFAGGTDCGRVMHYVGQATYDENGRSQD